LQESIATIISDFRDKSNASFECWIGAGDVQSEMVQDDSETESAEDDAA